MTRMNKPDFSVVVPCYNEAENLTSLLDRFSKVITDKNIELVLVNNGSTDNSAALLKKLGLQYNFIHLVNIEINQGYGHGILTGLRQAEGDVLSWTHADLQTDPQDVIDGYNLLLKQPSIKNCYLKGDRKGRPLMDQFFTFGMSLFETVFLKHVLWDINAQPNIFHRSFFDKWQSLAPNDFSLDLYVLYMAKHLKLNVLRFAVMFPERIHGCSSWNTGFESKWKFIKRTITFSFSLKKELKNDPLYRS